MGTPYLCSSLEDQCRDQDVSPDRARIEPSDVRALISAYAAQDEEIGRLREALASAWRSIKRWGIHGPCGDIEKALFGRILTYDEYPFFEEYARREKALPPSPPAPNPPAFVPAVTSFHKRICLAVLAVAEDGGTITYCGCDLPCLKHPLGADKVGEP